MGAGARPVHPIRDISRRRSSSVASLIGHSGSSAFRPSAAAAVCRYHSRARASLRNRPKAHPSWDSRTRRNNLSGGLASKRTVGPSDRANSPHPSSREGHHSTAGWSLDFLLSHLILNGAHAAATSRVQRKSVPSTQMRCRITANRRASATIAFLIPRCRAIFIAQALSQDHLLVRVSMTWAAS